MDKMPWSECRHIIDHSGSPDVEPILRTGLRKAFCPSGTNPGHLIKRNVFEDEDEHDDDEHEEEDERTRPSEQNRKPESHSPGASET